jgi:ribulose-phosphate 3-epimerase
VVILPTVLASDLKRAQHLLHQISQAPQLTWVQADIIDEVFANNKTLSPQDWSKLISQYPQLKFEAHLMVKDPIKWITPCLQAGFSRLTAQIEMMPDQQAFLNEFHPQPTTYHLPPKVGLALDLPTPVEKLDRSLLPKIDVILLMSVPAGFGGQPFHPEVLKKITALNRLRQQQKSNFQIAIDGGLNPSNINKIEKAGADLACIGHSLLKGDLRKNLQALMDTAKR